MNTTLARRLQKLEEKYGPSGDDPTGERRRRLAEGLCPDSGYDHLRLPNWGGAWRCVVCGRPFVPEPGPLCMQQCPTTEGRGCGLPQFAIADRATHPQKQWFDERHARQAVEDLTASMAPEHLAMLRTPDGAIVHLGDFDVTCPICGLESAP